MAGRERRKRGGNILITLGLLLIAAALALVAFNILEEQRAGEASARALARMDEAGVAEESAAPHPSFSADTPMPVAEVDGRLYVGKLSIPSLGMELPVLSEWSYAGLNAAPCRYAGSAYAGNLVICGHNYWTHFAQLENVAYGQEVVFTDTRGNAFSYQVASVEVLEPTAVEEMVESDYELSLFTCNFSGAARVVVRCSEVL